MTWFPRRNRPVRSSHRAGHAARPQLESLEGRSLLTLLPVDFAATITAPPVAYKGQLFFAANDGINGDELWKSDGTSAGTTLVKDLRAGALGSTPRSLTV